MCSFFSRQAFTVLYLLLQSFYAMRCLLKLLFCGCQIIAIICNCFLHQNTPFENHKNQICLSSPRIDSWQATLSGAVSLFTLGSLLSSRSFPKIVFIRNAHSIVSAFLLLDSDKKWGAFRYIQKVGFWFKNRFFPRLWKFILCRTFVCTIINLVDYKNGMRGGN